MEKTKMRRYFPLGHSPKKGAYEKKSYKNYSTCMTKIIVNYGTLQSLRFSFWLSHNTNFFDYENGVNMKE